MSAPISFAVNSAGAAIQAQQADASDNPLVPQNSEYTPFTNPAWSCDRPDIIRLIGDNPINAIPAGGGLTGTATVTCVAHKAGSPDITGQQVITVTGPVADHVKLTATLK